MDQRYLDILRRWLWLLVLACLISSGVTYMFMKDRPLVYEARVRLLVGPGIDTPNPDLNALRAGGQLMQTYAELAATGPFLQSIRDESGLNITIEDLAKIIDVKTNQETQVLSIKVTSSDPEQATTIANTAANALVRLSPSNPDSPTAQLEEQMRNQAVQLEQIIASTQATIVQLEVDLQTATDINKDGLIVLQTNDYVEKQRLIIEQLAQERTRLSDALNALTLLYDSLQRTTTNQVKIVEPALFSVPQTAPLKLSVLIAGLAGLIIAVVIVLVFEYFDDTVKSVDELVQATKMQLLGVIPQHRRLTGSGEERLFITAEPESDIAESYRMLGTKLISICQTNLNLSEEEGQPNVRLDDQQIAKKKRIRSILIVSAQISEENNEFATNLAVAISQSGKSVTLVDTNLHSKAEDSSAIDRILGVSGNYNLANLLTGESESLKPDQFDWAPGFSLVSSGSLSGQGKDLIKQTVGVVLGVTPYELLASKKMAAMINNLEKSADIVLLAAPPLSSFSDNLVLAHHVDGAIVLARYGETQRKIAVEVVDSLRSINVNIIGTVLDKGIYSLDNLLTKLSQIIVWFRYSVNRIKDVETRPEEEGVARTQT